MDKERIETLLNYLSTLERFEEEYIKKGYRENIRYTLRKYKYPERIERVCNDIEKELDINKEDD